MVSEAEKIKSLSKLPAVAHPLQLLRSQLPKNLLYHAFPHTEDVLSEVIKLATLDGLSEREIEILAIAAAWHDVGFIHSPLHNEPLAAEAAKKFLTSLSTYTPAEITLIDSMIRDTALVLDGGCMRQRPTTALSRYLLDADLANFGREDFFEKSELQRREINESEETFRLKTLALVENHVWLTPGAQKLWQAKKIQNLETLRRQIASA